MVTVFTMSKIWNTLSPDEESVSRESKIPAPFQHLLDYICGKIGNKWGEGGLDVVLGVSVVAENPGKLIDEMRRRCV